MSASRASADGGADGDATFMPVPHEFEFPYKPYPQQIEFMQTLFATCESGGVGLLESPTGTGKTISIICATLQWLEAHRKRAEELQQAAAAQLAAQSEADGDPDWLRDVLVAGAPQAGRASVEPPLSRAQRARQRQRARLARTQKTGAVDLLGGGAQATSKARTAAADRATEGDLSAFVLAGGDADSEGETTEARGRSRPIFDSSSDEEAEDKEGQDSEPYRTQVIFCSRTHSQLSQFVGEIARSVYADRLAVVSIASRRVTCINEAVTRGSAGGGTAGAALVNERCLDLQQQKAAGAGGSKVQVVGGAGSRQASKTKARKGGCPYLVQAGEQYEDWADDVLGGTALDVEELVKRGRARGVCPYYGARSLVGAADVVLAPYASVLSGDARDAVGLRLGGAVLVVDEAHNLVAAVNGVHTHEVGAGQVRAARLMLGGYLERFKARLAPRNAQRVQTLLVVAGRLLGAMGCTADGPQAADQQAQGGEAAVAGAALRVNDFLFGAQLDGVNFFELLAWVKEVRLVMKLGGYSQWQEAAGEVVGAAGAARQEAGAGKEGNSSEAGGRLGALHAFLGFLSALTSADGDGRVVVMRAAQGQQEGGGASLRYVLLNAAARFADVLSSCRAVILASGTLAPVASTAAQLFPGLLPSAPCTTPADAPAGCAAGTAGTVHVPHDLQQLISSCPASATLLGLLPPAPTPAQAPPPALAAARPAQSGPPPAPRPVLHFECGHVVPRENVECMVVCKGPTGRQLELRHAQRGDLAAMDEIARLLINVCAVVPGGLVVFVPSFSYLAQLVARWTSTGALTSLSAKKRVFSEPRGAGAVEGVLSEYAAAIAGCSTAQAASKTGAGASCSGAQPGASGTPGAQAWCGSSSGAGAASSGTPRGGGAVLLAVVGGKMSEGINFGDELGRCVVVVGLPYANPSDPELRERMAYLDARAAAAAAAPAAAHNGGGGGSHSGAGGLTTHNRQPQACSGASHAAKPVQPAAASGVQALTGQALYEGMCLNAVNQCIGRVVRHARDYAAVLLVDARYAAPGCMTKLPRWIQGSMNVAQDFGPVMGGLARFYRRHRQQAA